jgi:hypothetical protein
MGSISITLTICIQHLVVSRFIIYGRALRNQKENYIGGSSDRSAPASRRRIPAAPFLSNTSRTPPASIARRVAIKLLGRSLCSPLSNAAIARSETFACLASSTCDHLSHPRAARHCSGVMEPGRKRNLVLAVDSACISQIYLIYSDMPFFGLLRKPWVATLETSITPDWRTLAPSTPQPIRRRK